MKLPPRLVPVSKEQESLFKEQRMVPRFPLPKEQIKFFLPDGEHKVFAIRDLSSNGLGISLLEPGEVLLFPVGQEYQAEIKFDQSSEIVPLIVRRSAAWSIGFEFINPNADLMARIESFLNPLMIGKSLKKVSLDLNPEVAAYGLSAWYHGANATDLYFWSDTRGGVERVLLCVGNRFAEWNTENGLRSGQMERESGDKAQLSFDNSPSGEILILAVKILEQAEVLDYRLVSFLKDQFNS